MISQLPFHVDWVAGPLSVLGMFIVGRKVWWGWAIVLLSVALSFYINIHFRLWGFVPVNLFMFVVAVKNGFDWRRERI